MKYQQPTFSAPVSNGKLTEEEYEIAVGVRCPRCKSGYKSILFYNFVNGCSSDNHHTWHDNKD